MWAKVSAVRHDTVFWPCVYECSCCSGSKLVLDTQHLRRLKAAWAWHMWLLQWLSSPPRPDRQHQGPAHVAASTRQKHCALHRTYLSSMCPPHPGLPLSPTRPDMSSLCGFCSQSNQPSPTTLARPPPAGPQQRQKFLQLWPSYYHYYIYFFICCASTVNHLLPNIAIWLAAQRLELPPLIIE